MKRILFLCLSLVILMGCASVDQALVDSGLAAEEASPMTWQDSLFVDGEPVVILVEDDARARLVVRDIYASCGYRTLASSGNPPATLHHTSKSGEFYFASPFHWKWTRVLFLWGEDGVSETVFLKTAGEGLAGERMAYSCDVPNSEGVRVCLMNKDPRPEKKEEDTDEFFVLRWWKGLEDTLPKYRCEED